MLLLAGPGWAALGEPGHLTGLTLLLAAAVSARLLVTMTAVFLVPRRWRISYRHAHGREGARSAYISQRLRRKVFAADRHRCVYCHSGHDLQVDHVMPWSLGGMTRLLNLVTLCSVHNRVKSNFWVTRDGRVIYRPFEGADNRVLAAAILAAERQARRNPLRWVLALAG